MYENGVWLKICVAWKFINFFINVIFLNLMVIRFTSFSLCNIVVIWSLKFLWKVSLFKNWFHCLIQLGSQIYAFTLQVKMNSRLVMFTFSLKVTIIIMTKRDVWIGFINNRHKCLFNLIVLLTCLKALIPYKHTILNSSYKISAAGSLTIKLSCGFNNISVQLVRPWSPYKWSYISHYNETLSTVQKLKLFPKISAWLLKFLKIHD